VATNYQRTKEWFKLASNNIERVIRNYLSNDYADCIFRIQLSIEELQKALIFLLGMQFKKTHYPSKILQSVETNRTPNIERNKIQKIHQIANIAKKIENEETKTRYGVIKNGKLITPEDQYVKRDAIHYLEDLSKILEKIIVLLSEFKEFDKSIKDLKKYKKDISQLIENE
jgi:HEPN domain-containing protein